MVNEGHRRAGGAGRPRRVLGWARFLLGGAREAPLTLKSFAACALSGALFAAAHPIFGEGWGLPSLVWVALVPALLTTLPGSPRQAAAGGAVVGVVVALLVGRWIPDAVRLHYEAGPALAIGVALAHALTLAPVWALLFWGVHRLRRRGASLLWALPGVVVAVESWAPRVFPGNLGTPLYLQPSWLQIADIFGMPGVSAVVAVVQAAVVLSHQDRRAARRALGAAGLVALAAQVYGQARLRALDHDLPGLRAVQVGVVQPGIFEPRALADAAERLATLQRGAAALEARGAELILWPESAYRVASVSRAVGAFPQRAAAAAEGEPVSLIPQSGFKTPLLFGGVSVAPEDGARAWNTAWLLDGAGKVALRYDKAQMVPVVEDDALLRPLRYLFGAGFGPEGLQAGDRLGVGEVSLRDGSALRVGVLICYEGILSPFVAQLGAHRPDLILNIANDAHYGSPVERELHLAALLPRSIELRRSLARATLNGVSAFIDPGGRILQAERASTPAALLQSLPISTMTSLSPITGPVFAVLALGVCIFAGARRPTPPAARRSAEGPPS